MEQSQTCPYGMPLTSALTLREAAEQCTPWGTEPICTVLVLGLDPSRGIDEIVGREGIENDAGGGYVGSRKPLPEDPTTSVEEPAGGTCQRSQWNGGCRGRGWGRSAGIADMSE